MKENHGLKNVAIALAGGPCGKPFTKDDSSSDMSDDPGNNAPKSPSKKGRYTPQIPTVITNQASSKDSGTEGNSHKGSLEMTSKSFFIV